MRVQWLYPLVAVALTAACSSATWKAGPSENASTAARFGIPPGHLPPPGQCKVWIPGEPPGQQKKRYKAGNCGSVARYVPPGGWLVYRPSGDKKEVVVREYGRSGVVISIRAFDIVTGALLWQEKPGHQG
jgi:hypothetical protein